MAHWLTKPSMGRSRGGHNGTRDSTIECFNGIEDFLDMSRLGNTSRQWSFSTNYNEKGWVLTGTPLFQFSMHVLIYDHMGRAGAFINRLFKVVWGLISLWEILHWHVCQIEHGRHLESVQQDILMWCGIPECHDIRTNVGAWRKHGRSMDSVQQEPLLWHGLLEHHDIRTH